MAEGGSRRKSRKSPGAIVRAIFTALPVQKVASISEVAERTGCNWATTSSYLTLITWIQSQPKVIIIESGRRMLYKKERSR